MRRIALVAIITGFLVPFLSVAPASAQATRTWVSGVGDDANPCSRTAPCKTFAGAISKTAVNGEIDCLDPGGFGGVTIIKSITLDCTFANGSILVAGTAGITINATGSGDPLRIVRIRGLSINGSNAGTRSGTRGINIISALEVHIDNVLIDNFTQQGVADVRTNAGTLFITNSNFRNNGISGIGMAPSGGTLNVSVDNTVLEGNAVGIGTSPSVNLMVSRSVISGSTTNGLQSDGGQTTVSNSTISGNSVGVQANSGTVRLYNNDITFNTSSAINGTTTSFGLNRIAANGGAGTAPTGAGGSTTALGTQ
jgi:hypothetical protein